MADGLRFELRRACAPPVFKTGAFNRSATHPRQDVHIILNNIFFVNSYFQKKSPAHVVCIKNKPNRIFEDVMRIFGSLNIIFYSTAGEPGYFIFSPLEFHHDRL